MALETRNRLLDKITSVAFAFVSAVAGPFLFQERAVAQSTSPPIAVYEGVLQRGQSATQNKCSLTVLDENLVVGTWTVRADGSSDGGVPKDIIVTKDAQNPLVLAGVGTYSQLHPKAGQPDQRHQIRVHLDPTSSLPAFYFLVFWHGPEDGSSGHSHSRRCINLRRVL